MRLISGAMLLVLVAPAQQTPRFEATSQLVIETVSVTDKNGKVIEGLSAKDFAVTEDGVSQTISFCEFQKLQDSPVQTLAGPANMVQAVTQFQITPERPGDIR